MKKIEEMTETSKYKAGMLYARDETLLRSVGLADMVLLYLTLLTDNVFPGGFLSEFVSLECSMRRSSE